MHVKATVNLSFVHLDIQSAHLLVEFRDVTLDSNPGYQLFLEYQNTDYSCRDSGS